MIRQALRFSERFITGIGARAQLFAAGVIFGLLAALRRVNRASEIAAA